MSISQDLLDRGASCFPLYVYGQRAGASGTQAALFEDRAVNLSQAALDHLAALGHPVPEDVFFQSLAVQHAPAYLAEHAGALMQDWPRVPLPASSALLSESAALGRRVAALLNTEATGVPGIHGTTLDAAVRGVAVPHGNDLRVSAGWGHYGRGNAVMAGRGKVTDNADGTLDIWLNDSTRWAAVPGPVWAYTLGGYQVLKKWLSYRDVKVLGRALRDDEVAAFTDNARRVAALLALGPSLDANYAAVG